MRCPTRLQRVSKPFSGCQSTSYNGIKRINTPCTKYFTLFVSPENAPPSHTHTHQHVIIDDLLNVVSSYSCCTVMLYVLF